MTAAHSAGLVAAPHEHIATGSRGEIRTFFSSFFPVFSPVFLPLFFPLFRSEGGANLPVPSKADHSNVRDDTDGEPSPNAIDGMISVVLGDDMQGVMVEEGHAKIPITAS